MKAIIGLGNPGRQYARTRHNAGFWIIDHIAGEVGSSWKRSKKGHVLTSAGRSPHGILLFKPSTYMNVSGPAIRDVLKKHGIVPRDMLLCYDDLALPVGTVRMRAKGSAGGHNGVRSVIHYLGTQEFPRLRIGIGAVPEGMNGADYVLSAPPPKDMDALDRAAAAGASAALFWVEEGIEGAMSRFNKAVE